MSCELFYTSARKGLKPGSSGYCTVGATEGIPPALLARLESLSSFPSVRAAGSPNLSRDPAVYAHWRLGVGGRGQSVLSRMAPSGLDDSRRLNTLAYHLVLDPVEQRPAGPVRTMRQSDVLRDEWIGDSRWLAPRALPIIEDVASRACGTWASLTGDAGWAGVVAQACMAHPAIPIYLVCEPAQEMLPLLDEMIALLPASGRWGVTFNTHFTTLPAGLTCLVRCVLHETPQAKNILKHGAPGLLIDLTTKSGPAPDTAAADAARAASELPVTGKPG